MSAFIIRRLLQLLFVVWGTITLMFFIFFLLPDDPANLIAGGATRTVNEQVLHDDGEAGAGDGEAVEEDAHDQCTAPAPMRASAATSRRTTARAPTTLATPTTTPRSTRHCAASQAPSPTVMGPLS